MPLKKNIANQASSSHTDPLAGALKELQQLVILIHHLPDLKKYLKQKNNLNQVILGDQTPLSMIINSLPPKSSLEVLEFCHEKKLLDLETDIRPLYWAAEIGKIPLVIKLIEKIKDINTKIPAGSVKAGYDVLIGACLHGDFQVTKILLDSLIAVGAKPNDFTLFVVAQHCSFEIIKYFLEQTNADTDALTYNEQNNQIAPVKLGNEILYQIPINSALTIAAEHNPDKNVLLLLLEKSAYKIGQTIPQEIQNMRASAFCLLFKNLPSNNSFDTFNFFQQASLSLEQETPLAGGVPLHYAAIPYPAGTDFIKKALAIYPQSIAWTQPVTDGYYQGLTSLSFIINYSNIFVMRLLLKNEAVRNTLNNPLTNGWFKGLTPLALALERKHWEMVNLLISEGANIFSDVIDEEDTKIPLLLHLINELNQEALEYLSGIFNTGPPSALTHLFDVSRSLVKELIRYTNKSECLAIEHFIHDKTLKKFDFFDFLAAVKKILQGSLKKLVAPHEDEVNRPKHSVAFFNPTTSTATPSHLTQTTTVNIEPIPAYPAYQISESLFKKQELPLLLHHAFFSIKKIKALLANQTKNYYLLLMHLLRFSEAMYGYIRQTEDNSFMLRKEAFNLRNIAAHLYFCLDIDQLITLTTNMFNVVFPKLLAIFETTPITPTTTDSFSQSKAYKKLVSQLNQADNLLDTTTIQKKTLQAMQELLAKLEIIDHFEWIISNQDWIDEIMMRFAIIGQYARLLIQRDALFENPSIAEWLKDCVLVRNIVAHEFPETMPFNQTIFLPNKINKEGFFYMAEGLKRIESSILEIIGEQTEPTTSLTMK